MATTPLLLCLSCSSSPSPKPGSSAPFTTACCLRPICERCLTRNPRLRGYNPCLACLAGVAVVDKSRRNAANGQSNFIVPGPSGKSQEQESSMFVLEDNDEEDSGPAPPAYSDGSESTTVVADDDETLLADTVSAVSPGPETGRSNPPRYYIQRSDTLMGIALKYGVDGRTICELNSLPLSTLSTTPHILHTRTSLILPPTQRPLPPPPDPEVLEARKLERAEKRFQFVTKEVDWRVAKAYVSLAEDEDAPTKSKEGPEEIRRPWQSVLEARAVDQYLDDGEWEARQGRVPRIERFPPFGGVKYKT